MRQLTGIIFSVVASLFLLSNFAFGSEGELGVQCEKDRCVALARSKFSVELGNKIDAEEEASLLARSLLSKRLKTKSLSGVSEFSYTKDGYVYVCALYATSQEATAKELSKRMNTKKNTQSK